jgi:hypothetical protein
MGSSSDRAQISKRAARRATARAGASRREFVAGGAAAAIAAMSFPHILPAQARGSNDRPRIAGIGVGGKGGSDVEHAAQHGDVVALCDVDSKMLEQKQKQFPKAKVYRDFRKMFDEMADGIDAVTISTPDHVHGIAASRAMLLGKHVYCQKPLTQTVYEARMLRQLAQQKKLATQMGNQGSAGSGLRRAVEVVQAGVIGPVTELHVWSNRPIWPQGIERPAGEDPVPPELDWDLWLGPAKMRPFKGNRTYHPFAWRGWWDFGTGALGDMACHTVNMPFRALKMGYPTVVECEETSKLNMETFPKTSRIRFEFPARDGMPPLKFWWYDGAPSDRETKALRPPEEKTKDIALFEQSRKKGAKEEERPRLPPSGCLLIGGKGQLYSPDDYGSQFYVKLNDEKTFEDGTKHEAAKAVKQSVPRNEGKGGDDERQKAEWFAMMKGGPAAYANFDIAAYLTEIILLGCIAMRVGVKKRMDWDGPNMRSTNVQEAAQFVRRQSRPGWELPQIS